MELVYAAAYLLAGVMISLFIDGILLVIKQSPLSNWQRSFAIMFWPLILLNSYLNDED